MNQTLVQEITKFIKEKFIYDGELTGDLSLTENSIIDSMGIISLITHFESKYNITVEDEEINQNNFGSINKIVSFLESKIKK